VVLGRVPYTGSGKKNKIKIVSCVAHGALERPMWGFEGGGLKGTVPDPWSVQ